MSTSMDRIDSMIHNAEVGQKQTEELEQLQAVDSFQVEGIEINASSEMVRIFHRLTGEPRALPRLAAEIALSKRYRNGPNTGEFIFSAKETVPYYPGVHKCLLHPEQPEHDQYMQWGLPTCNSGKLASPGEVQRHMAMRHPSAFEIIRGEEEKISHAEEVEGQQAISLAIIDAMNRMSENSAASKPPLAGVSEIVDVTEAVEADADIEDEGEPESFEDACPICDEIFTAESKGSASSLRRQHQRSKH